MLIQGQGIRQDVTEKHYKKS